MAQAADKGKVYSFCSTAEISDINFCDGLEIKFTSPLCRIQYTGVPETVAKSGAPCFY